VIARSFEEAEDLQVFLKGEAPVPEERAELARLNEAFARQSVRAHGYLREGVGDVPPDGWSPVVRATGTPVTAIGRCLPPSGAPVVLVHADGRRERAGGAFSHF